MSKFFNRFLLGLMIVGGFLAIVFFISLLCYYSPNIEEWLSSFYDWQMSFGGFWQVFFMVLDYGLFFVILLGIPFFIFRIKVD